MDIGVNAVFEFTGTPPFRVHWTEQRKGSRLVEQSRKFDAHHGEVILQPEHEGQYTYVSIFLIYPWPYESIADLRHSTPLATSTTPTSS